MRYILILINYVFNMWLFQLSAYIHETHKASRSSYYRHQHLLDKSLQDLDLHPFPLTEDWLHVLQMGLQCGSLEPKDWTIPKYEKIQAEINKLGRCRSYFQMLLSLNTIYLKHSKSPLRDFLDSPDGRAWYLQTKKLSHRQRFPLESAYRAPPRASLTRELKVKALLRKEPLLRYKDLLELKIPNAQSIYESFEPLLQRYRKDRLNKIKQNLF